MWWCRDVKIRSLDRMIDIMKQRALPKKDRPTYRELGKTYRITGERVRQIEHKGHRLLISALKKEWLRKELGDGR